MHRPLVCLSCYSAFSCMAYPGACKRFKQLLALSLAYAIHAVFVLRSLAKLNVAIYNTLKRLTPVLVLIFKVED